MKNKILDRLKKISIEESPLPEYGEDWLCYDDVLKQFQETLESVGGSSCLCSETEVAKKIEEHSLLLEAKKIISYLDTEVTEAKSPHEMQDLDLAVVEGRLGVAENAAIWVESENMQYRSLLFLTQYMIIVIKKENILHHLAQAYDKISLDNKPYGCFISGPSKTADIESALVIGAHGTRSLLVLIVD